MKQPLKDRLPGILSLCSSLKGCENDLANLLQSHASHPAIANLRRKLIAFTGNLSAALNSSDATTYLAPLKHEHIQTICLGLLVCVPSQGTPLFDKSLDEKDRENLQSRSGTGVFASARPARGPTPPAA